MHYVQKASDDNLHFLYKHSDLVNNNKTCGYGEGNVSFQYSRPFRVYVIHVQFFFGSLKLLFLVQKNCGISEPCQRSIQREQTVQICRISFGRRQL